MADDDQVRIRISLSPDEYRMLTLWARWHNRPPATYAAQIVSARLEANVSLIDGVLIPNAAKARGIGEEELIKDWLGKEQKEDNDLVSGGDDAQSRD